MANPREINPDLYDLNGVIRIERGPVRRTDIATKEILSDAVTAPHYHAPYMAKAGADQVEVCAKDAFGKPIRLGEKFTYVDWLGERVWKLYKRRAEPVTDPNGVVLVDASGTPRVREVWDWIEDVGSKAAAFARANELAR